MDFVLLKELVKRDQIDKAMDLLYDSIDDLLLASEFNKVNRILITLMKENYNLAILIGALTITLPFQSKLEERDKFVKFVAKRAAEANKPPDILKGL